MLRAVLPSAVLGLAQWAAQGRGRGANRADARPRLGAAPLALPRARLRFGRSAAPQLLQRRQRHGRGVRGVGDEDVPAAVSSAGAGQPRGERAAGQPLQQLHGFVQALLRKTTPLALPTERRARRRASCSTVW